MIWSHSQASIASRGVHTFCHCRLSLIFRLFLFNRLIMQMRILCRTISSCHSESANDKPRSSKLDNRTRSRTCAQPLQLHPLMVVRMRHSVLTSVCCKICACRATCCHLICRRHPSIRQCSGQYSQDSINVIQSKRRATPCVQICLIKPPSRYKCHS